MTVARILLVAVVAAGCTDGSRTTERRARDAAARRAPPLDAAPTVDAPSRRAAADAVLAQGCGGSPIATATTDDATVASCERSDAASGEVTRLRVVRAPDGQVRAASVVLRGPSPRTPKRIQKAIDLLAPLLDEHQREDAWNILAQAISASMAPAPPASAGGVWIAGSSSLDDEAAPWQRSLVLMIGAGGAPPPPPEMPASIGKVGIAEAAWLETSCRGDAKLEELLGQSVFPAVTDDDWVTEPTGRWTTDRDWLRCVVRLSGGHRLTLAATLDPRRRRLIRLAIELDHGSRDTLAAVVDYLGVGLLPDPVRAAAVAAARGRSVDAMAGVRIQVDHPGEGHRVTITATP